MQRGFGAETDQNGDDDFGDVAERRLEGGKLLDPLKAVATLAWRLVVCDERQDWREDGSSQETEEVFACVKDDGDDEHHRADGCEVAIPPDGVRDEGRPAFALLPLHPERKSRD